MTTQQTPAPRPAAVDLDAAREYAITQPGLLMSAWGLIDALVADLAATRAERDAALGDVKDWRDCFAIVEAERDELRKAEAAAYAMMMDIERERTCLAAEMEGHLAGSANALASWRKRSEDAEAERDAARATVREWIAANGPGGWIDDLRKAAPVPAADVPPFLLARVQ